MVIYIDLPYLKSKKNTRTLNKSKKKITPPQNLQSGQITNNS